MRRLLLLCGSLFIVAPNSISLGQEDIIKWEGQILELEALDRNETDPENGILFIGSSSIRLWQNIARDMAPYLTIRRGYGGAKFVDLDHYIERLVVNHQCRAIVIFVANDISGKETDRTPGQVLESIQSLTSKIRKTHPSTPLFFVEITPTPSRWSAWRKIRELNSRIAEFCSDNENVYFISTMSHYLDAKNDQPVREYFVKDQLHQNEEGYQLWSSIIKSRLDEVLRNKQPSVDEQRAFELNTVD